MPRRRPWTDDDLRAAVAASRSMREVVRRLGVGVGGTTYGLVRGHIDRLGIDASHLPTMVDGRPRPVRSWTDDDLADAVRTSTTVSEVLRTLGYQPSGGMHRYITGQIARRNLDTSHFVGQSWNRGRPNPRAFARRPLDEILVSHSTYTNNSRLRLRLIAEGLKEPRCETCGICSWRQAPLPLALDHKNGDHTDNRLENLRILCPNCHAQTATWCRSSRPASSRRSRP